MDKNDKILDFSDIKELKRKQKIKELDRLINRYGLEAPDYDLWPDFLVNMALKCLKRED